MFIKFFLICNMSKMSRTRCICCCKVSYSEASVLNLFTDVIYNCSQYARVFVLVKPFQHSLMFVGNPRSLPLEHLEGASLV